MTVIALVSIKGSPGVTTAALALGAVWSRPILVAECDPAGGDVAAGLLRGEAPPTGGLLSLAVAARRPLPPGAALGHCIRLSEDDGYLLLPGLLDPAHAAAVTPAWATIAAAFRDLGDPPVCVDVLADCGRFGHDSPVDVIVGSDVLVVVLRPTLRQVQAVRFQLPSLRAAAARTGTPPEFGLLLVGDEPYGSDEVASALGVPVLATLADDPASASTLSDGAPRRRGFDRSPLIRTARNAAQRLARDADGPEREPQVPARPVSSGARP